MKPRALLTQFPPITPWCRPLSSPSVCWLLAQSSPPHTPTAPPLGRGFDLLLAWLTPCSLLMINLLLVSLRFCVNHSMCLRYWFCKEPDVLRSTNSCLDDLFLICFIVHLVLIDVSWHCIDLLFHLIFVLLVVVNAGIPLHLSMTNLIPCHSTFCSFTYLLYSLNFKTSLERAAHLKCTFLWHIFPLFFSYYFKTSIDTFYQHAFFLFDIADSRAYADSRAFYSSGST